MHVYLREILSRMADRVGWVGRALLRSCTPTMCAYTPTIHVCTPILRVVHRSALNVPYTMTIELTFGKCNQGGTMDDARMHAYRARGAVPTMRQNMRVGLQPQPMQQHEARGSMITQVQQQQQVFTTYSTVLKRSSCMTTVQC